MTTPIRDRRAAVELLLRCLDEINTDDRMIEIERRMRSLLDDRSRDLQSYVGRMVDDSAIELRCHLESLENRVRELEATVKALQPRTYDPGPPEKP